MLHIVSILILLITPLGRHSIVLARSHAFTLIYFGNEWMDEKKILHNIRCLVKKGRRRRRGKRERVRVRKESKLDRII
jgi:hypothetical protein